MADSPVTSSFLTRAAGARKSMRHVAAPTEGRLKLLKHQKHFSVVTARLVLRFNIYGTNLAAVLTCVEIRAGAIVRVIEAKTSRVGVKTIRRIPVQG